MPVKNLIHEHLEHKERLLHKVVALTSSAKKRLLAVNDQIREVRKRRGDQGQTLARLKVDRRLADQHLSKVVFLYTQIDQERVSLDTLDAQLETLMTEFRDSIPTL